MTASAGRPHVDETDLRILAQLVTDARLSQRALARSIGMSSPAVAERIAKLEASGVVVGYRAAVDWATLGRGMSVTVDVVSERSADQRELAKRVLDIPEVESVEIVTGANDLRLKLRVRDQAHLQSVFFDRLLMLPGVRHTDTSLVMASVTPDNYGKQVIDQLIEELTESSSTTTS
jgi:Lrp/AsnC family leucine-responsive transcriptional regulator